MNPEIVEVVARAIAAVPTWDGDTLAHDLTREELYAAAQAALTAARPAILGDQWRPIETAPRDGTQVLIAGGTVEYDAECFPEDRPFGGVHIASWCKSSQSWSGPYGSEYDAQYWHTPTHWQPLPAPPATAIRAAVKP